MKIPDQQLSFVVCYWSTVTLLVGGVLLGGIVPAEALDTTEPYGSRVVDLEYYLGYGGVGLAPSQRELSHEFILGYGLGQRTSLYVGSDLSSDQKDFAVDTELLAGFMGTLVDRPHFDLDLMLDLAVPSKELGALRWAPSIELNYDADATMASWGLYLRTGIEGRRERGEFGKNSRSWQERTNFWLNPGAYWHLSDRHELLIEYDQIIALGSDRSAEEDTKGIAVGYNFLLSDTFELISQIHRDFPHAGNRARVGVSVGFIATLPTGP